MAEWDSVLAVELGRVWLSVEGEEVEEVGKLHSDEAVAGDCAVWRRKRRLEGGVDCAPVGEEEEGGVVVIEAAATGVAVSKVATVPNNLSLEMV